MTWPPVGRMYTCHPLEGERYFLRRLLHYVKGARSFEHILRFDGDTFDAEPCDSLKAVCSRMGLLQDDREWDACLTEAAHYQSARKLRRLFNVILIHNNPENPLALWDKFKDALCADELHKW